MDVEFLVSFNASPYIAAQISGPPEDCSPAEGGEVEILDIYIGDVNVNQVVSALVEKELQTKIEADLDDIFAPDFDEPDSDD